MHQNTFGGRAPPGPAGELMRSPRLRCRSRGCPTSKEKEGSERARKGKGKGGKKGKRKGGEEKKGEGKGGEGRGGEKGEGRKGREEIWLLLDPSVRRAKFHANP